MKVILATLLVAALAGCASTAPASWEGYTFHPINPTATAPAQNSVSTGVQP